MPQWHNECVDVKVQTFLNLALHEGKWSGFRHFTLVKETPLDRKVRQLKSHSGQGGKGNKHPSQDLNHGHLLYTLTDSIAILPPL
jgi:hypothetical protein